MSTFGHCESDSEKILFVRGHFVVFFRFCKGCSILPRFISFLNCSSRVGESVAVASHGYWTDEFSSSLVCLFSLASRLSAHPPHPCPNILHRETKEEVLNREKFLLLFVSDIHSRLPLKWENSRAKNRRWRLMHVVLFMLVLLPETMPGRHFLSCACFIVARCQSGSPPVTSQSLMIGYISSQISLLFSRNLDDFPLFFLLQTCPSTEKAPNRNHDTPINIIMVSALPLAKAFTPSVYPGTIPVLLTSLSHFFPLLLFFF